MPIYQPNGQQSKMHFLYLNFWILREQSVFIFWFSTIWPIHGYFLISNSKMSVVKTIRSTKIWMLKAPFALLFIVLIVCILNISFFLLTRVVGLIQISNKLCRIMKLMLKSPKSKSFQQKCQRSYNWCNILVLKQLD